MKLVIWPTENTGMKLVIQSYFILFCEFTVFRIKKDNKLDFFSLKCNKKLKTVFMYTTRVPLLQLFHVLVLLEYISQSIIAHLLMQIVDKALQLTVFRIANNKVAYREWGFSFSQGMHDTQLTKSHKTPVENF